MDDTVNQNNQTAAPVTPTAPAMGAPVEPVVSTESTDPTVTSPVEPVVQAEEQPVDTANPVSGVMPTVEPAAPVTPTAPAEVVKTDVTA